MYNKIYIFGDSYCDPNYDFGNIGDGAWHIKLKNYFSGCKFYNYGLSGTGPHYSFKKFYDLYKNNEMDRRTAIIFMLSATDRIHFPASDPGEITLINWDFNKKRSYLHGDGLGKPGIKSYYENFKSEINFFFMTIEKEMPFLNHKNFSYLYTICKILDCKIFVIGSDDFSKYDFLKCKNFNYIDDIFKVSYREIFEKERVYDDEILILDNRTNHLSIENHEILFNNIKNFIENDVIHNMIQFKEDFKFSDECYFSCEPSSNTKFIYE